MKLHQSSGSDSPIPAGLQASQNMSESILSRVFQGVDRNYLHLLLDTREFLPNRFVLPARLYQLFWAASEYQGPAYRAAVKEKDEDTAHREFLERVGTRFEHNSPLPDPCCHTDTLTLEQMAFGHQLFEVFYPDLTKEQIRAAVWLYGRGSCIHFPRRCCMEPAAVVEYFLGHEEVHVGVCGLESTEHELLDKVAKRVKACCKQVTSPSSSTYLGKDSLWSYLAQFNPGFYHEDFYHELWTSVATPLVHIRGDDPYCFPIQFARIAYDETKDRIRSQTAVKEFAKVDEILVRLEEEASVRACCDMKALLALNEVPY